VLVLALVLLNVYPVQVVRTQMQEAAYADMMTGAINLAANLAQGPTALSRVKSDEFDELLEVFEGAQSRRVLILDSNGLVIHDNVQATWFIGRLALFPEVYSALEGYDSFSSSYSDQTFESRSAAPIVRDGVVEGVVFMYKNNMANVQLLSQIRGDMMSVTYGGLLLFVVLAVFFNVYLGSRFGRLLGGIDAMGRGDYDYQIEMGGSDELSEIAGRFNDLSKKLQRTEAVRRQFVSDASHELKTPLASIKLLSDSIGQNAHIRESDMREFVQDIGQEIQRLIRISEHLLSLTRLDSVPERRREKLDLGRNVQKCAELLRGSCQHYRVTLTLEDPGQCFVSGTEDSLFHIVFNLMENAIKYNRPGGNVWVSMEPGEGDTICLTVKDDGIGIPRDEVGKIFDRFYRVDKTRSRETGGTGLGLSIVREWAENLGGRIEVESRYGRGTAFRVSLPAWTEEVEA